MRTTDMETVYDLGNKMIEALLKEKVLIDILSSYIFKCVSNTFFFLGFGWRCCNY